MYILYNIVIFMPILSSLLFHVNILHANFTHFLFFQQKRTGIPVLSLIINIKLFGQNIK